MRYFLLLFGLCYTLLAGDAAAILKTLKGDVKIERYGGTPPTEVEGEELYSGDILVTGKDGALSVIFNDGTVVSLGNRSILRIDDYLYKPEKRKYRFELFLKRGSATVESGKIAKSDPDSVIFRVPQGTIGVRGTRFFVEVRDE